ncbi:MAG: ABC transporter ATP-binding protein [Myxococcales bacterium]|nr:ABC transporter ATP-binding protein [Myxococcales bacterium]
MTQARPTGLRALLRYIRPYRGRLWQGVALLVVTNVLAKLVPWLLKDAVDALSEGKLSDVMFQTSLVVACALGMGVVRTVSRVRVFNVGRDIEYDLRNDLLRSIHGLGPSFFNRMPTGETMSRAINDLGQVRAMIGFGSLNMVNSVLAYALALTFMLSMSAELTLFALAPYPLLIVAARGVGRAMYSRSRASQEAIGHLSSVVQETLSGTRIVRAFNNQAAQAARFQNANQTALERNMSLVVLRGLMWPLLMGIGSIGTLVVLWKGTSMVRAELLSVGELVAFLAYGEALKWPTMGLGYILAVIQRGRASLQRIEEILNAEPDVMESQNPREPIGEGALSVRGLSFAYGDRRILQDVSFDVPAGASLAIVGRTGSGKSTLASLLPRLLSTPPGCVELDGTDITELRVKPLRKAVAYAQQEPFLFSDTIARNIGYSLDDPYSAASMDQIRAAAEEASVLDEIEDLREGFQTLVGERGVQLSGGQKQRIALARALLNRPRVLVMDDPLSAVDAKTEATILGALDRAGADKTVVIITNRIAAARRADSIVVLDNGRIVERGTHESLSAGHGLYAALARRQQLEEELSAL